MIRSLLLSAALGLGLGGAASAGTLFADNFNGEALQLNATLDNWDVAPGTVDVIGENPNASFNFYPGNGNYLDMNGSNNTEGAIKTKSTLNLGLVYAKKYALTFSYGTNTAPGPFPVKLSFGLGTLSETLVLNSRPSNLVPVTYYFVYDGSGDYLHFADTSGTPGDNGGPVLDNVSLATVPLPAGGLLLLGALGGIAALRRRKAV